MRTIIGWAFLGAAIAGGLTLTGFAIFNFRQIFGPKDVDEVQAWARFSAIMTSLGMAFLGLVIGAIFGIVQARKKV
jgi:ABC-type phosphate/phosphonate transport system permease subunit